MTPTSHQLAAQRAALGAAIHDLEGPVERLQAWLLLQAALTRTGLLVLKVAAGVAAVRWLRRSPRRWLPVAALGLWRALSKERKP